MPVALLLLLCAAPAAAHTAGGEPGAPWWLSVDPYAAALVLTAGMLHARGSAALARRTRAGQGRRRRDSACFWAGLAALALAIVSPLDAWGEQLFSVHMVQHELLILGAAPLLVRSRPLPVFLWSLPQRWRMVLARGGHHAAWRVPWRVLAAPLAAWALHAVALWQWHVPLLFEAALHDPLMHSLQHLSFFVSALLFWWSLLSDGQQAARPGLGVVYVFTTAVHSSLLGALLTFSPTVWYPSYAATAPAWGLSAAQDQQVGGLIMWVPSGVVFIAIGLYLMEKWLCQSRRRLERLESGLPGPRRGGG